MDRKCLTCSEYNNCKDSFSSWVFFIIGIIATLAVRAVTVFMHVNPVYAKIAWNIGIIGFFLFFVYRFRVSQARSEVITERHLVSKVDRGETLEREDYRALGAILCGLTSKKERINYIVIFSLSVVALGLAIYLDFLR